MNIFKTLTATAILALGISGAFYAVQNYQLATPLPTTSNTESLTENKNLIQHQPFVEQLSPKQTNSLSQESSEDNLINQLAKDLAKTLTEKNPNGPEIINGEQWINAPRPEKIAADLIAEAALKFDPESLKPTINNADLNISSDNSKKALINYLANFNQIIEDSAKKIPTSSLNTESLSLKIISQLVDIYQENINQFYQLPVPSSALEIHKKEIRLLSAQKKIFEKMENYQENPLTAILALNELKNIAGQFINLEEELTDFIKNNNLNN